MKRIITFVLTFILAINPAVMDAFYRDGGTVRYTDSVTFYGQPAWGTIHYRDLSIRIARDAPESTLAHEMGHYLYHRQVWSGTLQEHAKEAFASSPLRVCDDENFARGYAMYCTGRLGGKLAEFYREIESNL